MIGVAETLLDKYQRMLALRQAHARGEPVDTAAVRALAHDYPGALRELDRIPLDELEARVRGLAHGDAPPWAEPMVAHHRWLAAALRVRRVAGRDRDRDRAAVAWAAEAPLLGGAPEDLDFLLDPPEGRLSGWVVARLAKARDEPPSAVREAIFGHLKGGW